MITGLLRWPGLSHPAANVLRRAERAVDTTTTGPGWVKAAVAFFEAFAYALANLAVISARDVIDNPLSTPHDGHRLAGILM